LRHCAISWHVAVSIPDGFTGIFNWEWRKVKLSLKLKWIGGVSPRDKGGRCLGLKALPPSYADCQEILGVSASWSPKGLSRPFRGMYVSMEMRGRNSFFDIAYLGCYLALVDGLRLLGVLCVCVCVCVCIMNWTGTWSGLGKCH